MGSTPAEQPNFFSLQIAEARRFHIDLNPPKDALLSVVSGGCEHCSADYEIHRASFPYFGIEFVTQGRGKLTLDGRSYDLVPGTVFAYGPRISQDIISDQRERLVKYFVDFTGKHAKRLLDQYGPRPGHVVQTSAPGEMIALFDELIRNGLRSTPFTPRIGAALVEYLILKIADTTIPLGSFGTPAFATYRKCRQWILDHADQIQTLEQVAASCHIDPAYLCRLFRRFDHTSPYQFLLRLKMNEAADRLRMPGVAIKQVAEEMGYSDPFHFSRVFKKAMGLAPAQYVRLSHRA
jgi:AraC-like DNA-binding protein